VVEEGSDNNASNSRELVASSPRCISSYPRPLLPQSYPGQDIEAVDRQPFIGMKLADVDTQSVILE